MLAREVSASAGAVLEDMRLGNGDDDLTAPIAHVAHLRADFVLQVPRQDEYIVRPRLPYPVGRENRDVRSWGVLALLVRVSIHRVVEQGGADAAIVQQRIAFSRSAITDDALAAVLELDQQRQHLAL